MPSEKVTKTSHRGPPPTCTLLLSYPTMLALRTATRYTWRRPRNIGQVRLFTNTQGYDAIVLNASSDSGRLSLAESQLISQSTRSAILEQLSVSNFKKAGDVRVLYNVGGVKQVAVVNLGDRKQLNQGDNLEGKRLDAARTAVSFATLLLSYDGDHVR